ncbi:hypothetical protein BU23DRAFT_331773 [Bimuria novae-zelandiae CBS 107.79]|uniref:C2H2-type domain-containing protein n=1 Tax=Bimuria novae-zelandiae CBS 107.79 TaxID=1447943 RepID=A0A6A5UNA7_9PLEO|nr:hypothetical protein BU23DRAFT_331773 [Bimuria novae-zelandiae CBS 107.79]
MAPAVSNRFALLKEDEIPSSKLPVTKSTLDTNPFVNQVANTDTPWAEVKPGVQPSKAVANLATMAPAFSNRFALFKNEDEESQPTPVKEPTFKTNTFVNQVANTDTPWEEVKRGGRGGRGGQAVKPVVRTLVIRNSENKPLVNPVQQRTHDISAYVQNSDTARVIDNMRANDLHEHYCGVCQHKFPNKTALLTHIKQSPKGHENYCNLCKRVFKDRNGLQNHVDNAAGHEIFCNLCLSAFVNAWGLKNHLENNYSVAGHDYVCLTCLLGFRTKADLDRHLITSGKHVWCNTCHKKFKDQTSRDAHWQITTKHRHCLQPGCDFDAPNEKILEKHLRDDHFQCEGCKRIFPSQTKLNLHHETCQFEIRCSYCAHRCAGMAQLALHKASCFYCAECCFQTNHEGAYQMHMTKHHLTKPAAASFPCWRCDMSFRKCSTLIHHLDTGRCVKLPDPIQLLRCLGSFWHSTLYMDVDIHVQIRSNRVDLQEAINWMKEGLLQPFVCRAPGCGKTFSQFNSLVLHIESQSCEWDVKVLRLDLLRAEFDRMCEKRDNATVLAP